MLVAEISRWKHNMEKISTPPHSISNLVLSKIQMVQSQNFGIRCQNSRKSLFFIFFKVASASMLCSDAQKSSRFFQKTWKNWNFRTFAAFLYPSIEKPFFEKQCFSTVVGLQTTIWNTAFTYISCCFQVRFRFLSILSFFLVRAKLLWKVFSKQWILVKTVLCLVAPCKMMLKLEWIVIR